MCQVERILQVNVPEFQWRNQPRSCLINHFVRAHVCVCVCVCVWKGGRGGADDYTCQSNIKFILQIISK